jgi:hypothetical protein
MRTKSAKANTPQSLKPVINATKKLWRQHHLSYDQMHYVVKEVRRSKLRHAILATSVHLSRPYAGRTNSNSSNCCVEKDLRTRPGNDRGRYPTNDSWGFNGINVPCGEAKRVG